jgi:EmrB/QacA subfamily drug resistance transporter
MHAASTRDDRRRWYALGALALSLVIIGIDNTVLNVALPTLQRHFHASSSTLEWMVDAYMLVFAGLLLTMGTLGDRFGRKRALQAGTALFGAASIGGALASSAGEVIAARATMGIGAALIMPATLSIITNVFPAEERGKAIGIWSGLAGVGIGLGPLLGGLLLRELDWSSVFWVNVPVCAAALVASARFVPDSRDPSPGAFDLVGAALSTAALASLVYGIIEAPGEGWLAPRIDAAFAVALVLGVAFAAWELHTPAPMLDLGLFRNPRFAVASFGLSSASFTLMATAFLLTQYLQFAHGYSALGAGAAMLPLAFGLVAGAGMSTKLVARIGTTRVVAAGMLLLAATLCGSLAWSSHMAYWAIGLSIFAIALAAGNVMGPTTESIMGAVPPHRAGVASAMNDVNRQVAGAIGVAVIGSLTTTAYHDRAAERLPALPERAREAAEASIGSANAVAATLPAAPAHAVAEAAARAYTEALGLGLTVAALVSIAAAVVVARRLPARHLPATATVAPRFEPLAA